MVQNAPSVRQAALEYGCPLRTFHRWHTAALHRLRAAEPAQRENSPLRQTRSAARGRDIDLTPPPRTYKSAPPAKRPDPDDAGAWRAFLLERLAQVADDPGSSPAEQTRAFVEIARITKAADATCAAPSLDDVLAPADARLLREVLWSKAEQIRARLEPVPDGYACCAPIDDELRRAAGKPTATRDELEQLARALDPPTDGTCAAQMMCGSSAP